MRLFNISFILYVLPCVYSQADVPINYTLSDNTGSIFIFNHCTFDIYYESVDMNTTNLQPRKLSPTGFYEEQWHLSNRNGISGGVSIKITPNSSIADASNQAVAFDQSSKVQFQYNYNPSATPSLLYAISNVDGYTTGWQNASKGGWPFQNYGGLIMQGFDQNNKCPGYTCPPDVDTCISGNTEPTDEGGVRGCEGSSSIALTLCSTSSAMAI